MISRISSSEQRTTAYAKADIAIGVRGETAMQPGLCDMLAAYPSAKTSATCIGSTAVRALSTVLKCDKSNGTGLSHTGPKPELQRIGTHYPLDRPSLEIDASKPLVRDPALKRTRWPPPESRVWPIDFRTCTNFLTGLCTLGTDLERLSYLHLALAPRILGQSDIIISQQVQR